MRDFLESKTARELIERAETARLAVTEADPGSSEQREAAKALDAIYAELGMELHNFLRMGAETDIEEVDDADTMERRIVELIEPEEDVSDPPTLSAADNEITVQRRMEDLVQAGFGDDVTMTIPHIRVNDGVDTATDGGQYDDERTASGERTDGYVQSVFTSGPAKAPPKHPKPLPHVQSSGWVGNLRDLLSTMELPQRWDDGVEVATEAALVQWATTGLGDRWRGYPPAIQIALIGLVASRARFLEERLAVPAGPKIALERLRDFRRLHKLSPVVALLPERGPEHTSWDADARHWWGVLVDGMAA
ncbi:MAG: hypothetical protein EP330_16230 [Deltaproteobacteria bacterium]|nr:MAG: hypothetical protein EP330_16230 [Deltaproteobacteria bacterium]